MLLLLSFSMFCECEWGLVLWSRVESAYNGHGCNKLQFSESFSETDSSQLFNTFNKFLHITNFYIISGALISGHSRNN